MNWEAILLNDLGIDRALAIVVKTAIMFLLVLLFLRLSGKKGVRELTFFEVAIIISLGTAAGEPMLSEEAAIVPSLIAFIVVIAIYRLLTFLAARSERFEQVLEGTPFYIIEDGMFTLSEESDNNFAKDEFFSELRGQSVEHLGQIRAAILETSGMVSFFYYRDEEVKPGLPLLPKLYEAKSTGIDQPGEYACTSCGQVETRDAPGACSRCGEKEWVLAIGTLRLP